MRTIVTIVAALSGLAFLADMVILMLAKDPAWKISFICIQVVLLVAKAYDDVEL